MESEEKYVEYASQLSELVTLESAIYNKRRLVEELKQELKSDENNKSCGLEFTGHAFKQISERLEEISMENSIIYREVFKSSSPSDCLLMPSNLKSFIITILSDANKNGQYKEEESRSNKNSDGTEYRYTINMNKWSGDKALQFIAIVENNYIKTGFFNWV